MADLLDVVCDVCFVSSQVAGKLFENMAGTVCGET